MTSQNGKLSSRAAITQRLTDELVTSLGANTRWGAAIEGALMAAFAQPEPQRIVRQLAEHLDSPESIEAVLRQVIAKHIHKLERAAAQQL